MSRRKTRWALFAAILLVTTPVAQAAAGAYVTLASDYVYRGLTMTKDDPALQFGVDYQHDSGWFAGAWASTIDVRTRAGKRDLEVDYYTGFHLQPSSSWSAILTLLHYSYPGASGDHGYDHSELVAAANWNDRWIIELAYTNDLYGLDATGRHWELRTEQPFGDSWQIGAGVGGNDLSDIGTSHFLHWDVGFSYVVSRLSFDFRFYDNERPEAGLARALAADAQFVVSVTATF